MDNRPDLTMVGASADPVAAEIAVAFTELAPLKQFVAELDTASLQPMTVGCGDLCLAREGRGVARIHFGNEFCERLLPSRAVLEAAICAASEAGLGFSLVLPPLTDAGLDAADRLLDCLPAHAAVVVNDWGTMRRVRRGFGGIELNSGRILCRMLKEPRAPSARFMELGGHGYATPGLHMLVRRFAVSRINIDVPPFAALDDLRGPGIPVSLHIPFGFATFGRVCRIGSLHQPPPSKFGAGHNCARECLTYSASIATSRAPHPSALRMFQRGNTIFYRHDAAMTAVAANAIKEGIADRIIVCGDWNEAGRPDYVA